MLKLEQVAAVEKLVAERHRPHLDQALAQCTTPFERITTEKVFSLAWRVEALERVLAEVLGGERSA